MDEGASRAVREVFVRLYEEGLIYRAHRLVNWCTDCFTAVSDLEVNNVEESGHLWELQYPVVGSDQRITVATTRPETMLGDTGVAVHPGRRTLQRRRRQARSVAALRPRDSHRGRYVRRSRVRLGGG